jgi:hypothetical protein
VPIAANCTPRQDWRVDVSRRSIAVENTQLPKLFGEPLSFVDIVAVGDPDECEEPLATLGPALFRGYARSVARVEVRLAVAARASRVSVVIKADWRAGVGDAMTGKTESVERYLSARHADP